MPQYSGIWTLNQAAQAIKNQDWAGVPPTVIEYLIVAGGGGGGSTYSGGGGGGGLLQGYAGITPSTSYYVTVGAGGTAATSDPSVGGNGGNSVFDSTSSGASTGRIAASGGGGGGAASSGATAGAAGGSGGGGGGYGGLSGGGGISGQGNAGGTGLGAVAYYGGGGGGGAGTIGFPGLTTTGGNGGAGIASDITGTRTSYAGGGAGGIYQGGSGFGVGGAGGGASCPTTVNTAGNRGQTNTGGGGSGTYVNAGGIYGGAGGSGIVVIRYPGNVQYFTGGTLNYSNGFIVHTFYSSGTLTPIAPRLFATPDYQIQRSIRFNSSDGPLLERAGSAGGNRKTWTWSGWIKRSKLNSSNTNVPFLFGASDRVTGSAYLQFGTYGSDSAVDCLSFQEQSGGSYKIITQAKFRDTSAWYHVVCAYDTTQATASDRIKIYINGILQTITSDSTYPPQNNDGYVNYSAYPYLIGAYDTGSVNSTFDGYMAEVNFVDGQQLTPQNFGYLEPTTGVWTPLQYVGSYGTRGYYLNFADNSNTTAATLGKDLSGNANNFTPYNFSVSAGVGNDSLLDSPTNYGVDTGAGGEVRGNYCTWSPLANLGLTLTNGNLSNSYTTASWTGTTGTMAMDSGTWYFEYTVSATATYTQIGVIGTGRPLPTGGAQLQNGTAYAWTYQTYGQLGNNSTYITSGISSATTNDIIMVAVDVSNGKIWFGKNGTWFNSGSPSTGANAAYTNLSGSMIPAIYSYGTESGNINFGQRPFAYTAPSGFKALCSQNLPAPAILPQKAFAANTFSSSSSNRVIGTGIQSDLVWTKRRDATGSHLFHDAVRGAGKTLYGETTSAEVNNGAYYVQGFNSDSYSIGSSDNALNGGAGATYVSWTWNAGGTTVTNTQGTISAQVRANPQTGFSIATYTGSGANATIGHGLGIAPSMIIQKNLTGYNWRVYHASAGNTNELYLDQTTPATTAATWNNTTPTTTVFSVGSGSAVNGGGFACVAYCFAEVAGYSKFGSYVGNGAVDGPFVYTGFRPAFILTKDITTSSFWWEMVDSARSSYNPSNKTLYANVSDAEYTSSGYDKDLLSNGFKIRGTNGGQNTSGSTYIYMAFAESPLKYTRAR